MNNPFERLTNLLLESEKQTIRVYTKRAIKPGLFLGPVLPFGIVFTTIGIVYSKILLDGTNMFDDETTLNMQIAALKSTE